MPPTCTAILHSVLSLRCSALTESQPVVSIPRLTNRLARRMVISSLYEAHLTVVNASSPWVRVGVSVFVYL